MRFTFSVLSSVVASVLAPVLASALALALALTLDPFVASAQDAPKVGAPEVEAVARELMDPCENCKGKLLAGCDCEPAAKLKEDIRARLQRGETKEQIVETMVAQYGEWIRAAPPKSGFNLVGWGMPFALMGLGGVAIALYLRRAVRRRIPSLEIAPPIGEAAAASPPIPDAHQSDRSPEWNRRLASEIDRFNQ